jgi:hypothetical protein
VPVQLPLTEIVLATAIGVSLAAAAGLRVFLPVLVLGTAGRLGWVTLGSEFDWLATNVGLVTLAVATLAEVAAYYVPALDNALDLLAVPAAVGAGVIATAAVTGDLPTPLRWSLAVIAGGGTAGVVQSLTTLARLKSTGLTAGLANPALATFELGGATLIAGLAVAAPFIALAFVILVVMLALRVRRALNRRRRTA